MEEQAVAIIWLAVGGVAGWMAGKVLKRTLFGVIGDIVAGMAGGFGGAWLWTRFLYPPTDTIDQLKAVVVAAVGGIVLVVLWRVVHALR
ncbi:MAG: GlsB/YeaQ/YmgE family stress response membrane protein [Bradyrhizobiaceae bacterium]|nr:GlsB/YeaQ/YmgE family stress response membrane protein [Bradyrhizobiaceae bacterium]